MERGGRGSARERAQGEGVAQGQGLGEKGRCEGGESRGRGSARAGTQGKGLCEGGGSERRGGARDGVQGEGAV